MLHYRDPRERLITPDRRILLYLYCNLKKTRQQRFRSSRGREIKHKITNINHCLTRAVVISTLTKRKKEQDYTGRNAIW
jgi:hypothetical protein